jgi:hypothetical protein
VSSNDQSTADQALLGDYAKLFEAAAKVPVEEWPGLFKVQKQKVIESRSDWLASEKLFIAWCLLLMLAVVAVLIGHQVPWSDLFKNDKLAAWIQAGGSLLALAVAIGVAGHQGRQARRQEAERERRDKFSRAVQTYAIIQGAKEAAQPAILYVRISLETSTPAAAPFRSTNIDGAIAVVRQAMLLPLPDLAVSLLVKTHGHLTALSDLATRCGTGQQKGDKSIALLLKYFEHGLENVASTSYVLVEGLRH